MNRYLRAAVIIISAYLIISSLISFFDYLRERKAKAYLSRIIGIEFDQVENVSLLVRETPCLKKPIIIRKEDYDALLDAIQSCEVMSNQKDRMYPSEIFEVSLSLKNGESICFLLFNSKKHGGVIRFFNNCENTTKALDALSNDLLQFVHSKCR